MGFASEIDLFLLKAKAKPELIVKKILFDISASVVAMSPVDTGRFRANWQYGFGTAPTGTIDEKDSAGAQGTATTDKLSARVGAHSMAGVHFIVNNLAYAQVLEYGLFPNPPKGGTGKTIGGYSTQAPAGMVRITVARFDEFIRKAASEGKL